MILQRIIGRRGSGRTTVALSQAYANSPAGKLSLYACRSMDDANRCYRNYVDRWRGATFKRYFVEWQKRNTRGTHSRHRASSGDADDHRRGAMGPRHACMADLPETLRPVRSHDDPDNVLCAWQIYAGKGADRLWQAATLHAANLATRDAGSARKAILVQHLRKSMRQGNLSMRRIVGGAQNWRFSLAGWLSTTAH